MLNAVATAFKIPDLRQRILFTLGMLVIFRFPFVLQTDRHD